MIAAPADGVVANLRFTSVGGVVGAGEPILDVVPSDDRLLADARVSPLDFDVVRVGLGAQVHLSAHPGRSAPRITGRVASVSADTMIDEATGQPYDLARVEVPRSELDKAPVPVALVPGMTADVLIVTAERMLAGYVLEPIADIVRRALREV